MFNFEKNIEKNLEAQMSAKEEKQEKKGFFKRLVEGLSKTRNNIVSGLDSVFSGFSKIDEDFYEELEEILIMGDLGVRATEQILDELRDKVIVTENDPAELMAVIDSIAERWGDFDTAGCVPPPLSHDI